MRDFNSYSPDRPIGTETIPEQGYYADVAATKGYSEKVLVKEAYDETVVTGYKCSACGATK